VLHVSQQQAQQGPNLEGQAPAHRFSTNSPIGLEAPFTIDGGVANIFDSTAPVTPGMYYTVGVLTMQYCCAATTTTLP